MTPGQPCHHCLQIFGYQNFHSAMNARNSRPHRPNDNKCPNFKLFCSLFQTNMLKRDFNSLDIQVMLFLKNLLGDNSSEKVKLIIFKPVKALFINYIRILRKNTWTPMSPICDFFFFMKLKLIFTKQKSCTFVYKR